MEEAKKLSELIKDPIYFSQNILGGEQPWSKQQEIMEAVAQHNRVAVRSGNGVGKTWISARIALWFLAAHYPARVLTTAPTWAQVEKLIWSEIHSQYHSSKIPLGGELLKTELRVDEKTFMIGLSVSEPTNFQGHHEENILIIFDEALGIPPQIWDAAEGNLTSGNAKWLAIGNPVAPIGRFYECFKSPVWKKLKISCLDSPNIAGGEDIPGLVTQTWVDERKKEWGEQSPVYKARVLGEFPIEGEDTLIPLTWVERAVGKEIPAQGQMILGIDVARFGSDSTVFTVMQGKGEVFCDGFIGSPTTKTVGQAIDLCKKYSCEKILVDDTGVGGGVTDLLKEHFQGTGVSIVAVNFGSKARDSERFANLKTEIFWNLREDFENGIISILDEPRLIYELPSIMYEINSKGQLRIVGKDKMKKMGMKSPDYADSLAIAHYGSYENKKGLLDYYKAQYGQPSKQVSSFINQANL